MNRYIIAVHVLCILGSSNALASDWHEKGFNDGIRGLAMKNVASLEDSSEVATTEYKSAYFDGLNQYCQPVKAEELGNTGESYTGICKYTNQAWNFQTTYHKASINSEVQRNRERFITLSKTRWY